MNLFSFILSLLSVVYLSLGFKVFRLDRRALANRLFLTLSVFLIVWSVASAFYIGAQSRASCVFWYRLGSAGFYLFVATVLHFFLVYADYQAIYSHKWLCAFLYFPGCLLAYQELTADFYVKSYDLSANGWIITAQTDSPWFWASIAYIVLYIGASIVLIARFRSRTTLQRERKQSRLLMVTAFLSLLSGLVIMVLASMLQLSLPDATPLSAAFWVIGIYYAIIRFKLMAVTPAMVADNLFQTIIDSVILADQDGKILNANPETQAMLGYEQGELTGKPLETVFIANSREKNADIYALLRQSPIRSLETAVVSKNGARIPVMLSISACNDEFGTNIGYVLASKDVTAYKQAEEKIKYLATHDSLTGLPNRLMFTQILNHSIQSAKRHKRKLAVFFIDLDRFKIINDTKGHDAGDQLLQEIANRYKRALRESDVVSRQGGDEFVILVEDVAKVSDLAKIADTILLSTYQPVVLQQEECRVTASVGISVYPKDGEDEQTLMKNADTAMYYAKAEGKNNFQFYYRNIRMQTAGRMDVEKNLRFALERNELSLHYQAKVDVKTGKITGVEALLRWQNPALGSVAPATFIPVAEETGMILPIGKWVLQQACAQNVAWQKLGLPPVCMAVNLSLRQVTDPNLIVDVKAALNASGLSPHLLELEITESMIMTDPERMIAALGKIKKLGVRLSIDDFGTGYSSLAKLKDFPIDTLKIDRSFIRNLPENAEDKAITQAIIAMGESLSLTVIAEGVETEEQLNFLKEQLCDEVQGFYFNKPMEPDKFADMLREYAAKPSA